VRPVSNVAARPARRSLRHLGHAALALSVCSLARVSPSVIERGREEPTRLAEGLRAFHRFADRLCFLPGGNAESVADVEAYARAALRRHAAPRCLIVLDYLQRMAYRGGTPTCARTSRSSR